MSKLDQCRTSLQSLLTEIDQAASQYKHATDLLHLVHEHEDEDTVQQALADAGFSLTASVHGASFPAQLPLQSRATILNMLEAATNAAGIKLIDLWRHTHEVTKQAVEHCELAKQQAGVAEDTPEPGVESVTESITTPPPLQPPTSTPLEPIRTTPIGS